MNLRTCDPRAVLEAEVLETDSLTQSRPSWMLADTASGVGRLLHITTELSSSGLRGTPAPFRGRKPIPQNAAGGDQPKREGCEGLTSKSGSLDSLGSAINPEYGPHEFLQFAPSGPLEASVTDCKE